MARRILPHAPSGTIDGSVLFDGEVVVPEGTGEFRVGDGVTPGGVSVRRSDMLSVLDFVPRSQWAATRARTNITNMSGYFQSAMDVLAARGGGTLFVPAGLYRMTSHANQPTEVEVVGEGRGKTIFDVGNDNRLFVWNSATSRYNSWKSFSVICSDATAGPSRNGGIIERDVVTGVTVMAVFDEVEFDTAKNGRNGIFVKARPTCPLYGFHVRNSRFPNTGRANVEVIQHEADQSTQWVDDVQITNNRFGRCGLIAVSIALSLSGAMRAALIAGNEFFQENAVSGYGFEPVGRHDGIRVAYNHFRGQFQMLISQSERGDGYRLTRGVFIGNTSEVGTVGKMAFGATENSTFIGNVLDTTGPCFEFVHEYSNSNLVTGNQLKSAAPTAILFDNSPNNRVVQNVISNEASAGNFATVRSYGALAVNNRVQHNEVRKGTGGTYVDFVSGASANVLGGNILGTTQMSPPGTLAFSAAGVTSGSLAAGAKSSIATMTATGVALGDEVSGAGLSVDLAGMVIRAWVSAADTISYYFHNENGANPLTKTGTLSVTVRDRT